MFIPIVNTSISASWLILAIIVIRFVFKKMPKAVTCVLWGLLAIRLICPFSIESSLSLVPSAEIIPEEVLYMEGAQLNDPVEFNGIEAPTIRETVGEAVGETVSQVQTFDVYGTLIWLAGMAAMLLYALISYLRLRYRVMVSSNERDNIWLCDQIDSPFILGMFRPRIYMPSGMAEEQATYVIAHEQAHLQRHDHWWKPFGFLLLSVYWFNPLIWVAYILLSRDIELACDEKVIRSMEAADKQAYSEALLVCSVNRRMIAACPLAFGEVGVKARVKSVLNYKKPAFWVVVGSVVICAVVAVCFLTDPTKKDTEALGETVSWIHAPDGVAWHAAIHFNFRLEHTHIEASCDRGMLWDLYSEDMACLKYGWSKQELSAKITENAHENTILDTETRVWYTESNNQSMEEQKHDKDTVCLLWEYMPQSNGGVRDEGFGTKSWPGKAVRDCLRSDQHGRDRESCISSSPAQTGRAWNQLYRQGGSAVEEQRFRSIRSVDRNGPFKPAEYVSYLWRRLLRKDALDDGLYRPPWRGCRSVVYGRFRGYLAGCSGGLSRVA